MCVYSLEGEKRWQNLYQLGTDQREKVFSRARIITRGRNCDILELFQRLLHGEDINQIISKYPELKRFHGKRITSYNDASSEHEWSGDDLEVKDVDCYRTMDLW